MDDHASNFDQLFKQLALACADPQVPELRLTDDSFGMRPINPSEHDTTMTREENQMKLY